ncbi:universal stress protein [uncultured Methanobrevibacter sp.]|uniref:universal stress protein n=1 Tax=uncultured Methanobrevibacter sp. TaxID=253161 RepID=UPI0025D580AF|nr:universal stress protein [uncultured Methanobrevibacter sp.]
MYKKILLPTDGSDYANQEIPRALNVLDDDGELLVVSVATKIKPYQFQNKMHVRALNQKVMKEARDNVEKMKAEIGDVGVKVKTKVVSGFPAESIKKIANEEDVDLIVISSSGKSGLHKLLIGSVAEKIVSIVDTDVLLIHN